MGEDSVRCSQTRADGADSSDLEFFTSAQTVCSLPAGAHTQLHMERVGAHFRMTVRHALLYILLHRRANRALHTAIAKCDSFLTALRGVYLASRLSSAY